MSDKNKFTKGNKKKEEADFTMLKIREYLVANIDMQSRVCSFGGVGWAWGGTVFPHPLLIGRGIFIQRYTETGSLLIFKYSFC